MQAIRWLLVAVLGFAAMLWSYLAWQRTDRDAPWATGLMALAASPEDAGDIDHAFAGVSARVRLLDPGPLATALISGLGAQDKRTARSMRARLSEKLVEVDLEKAGIGPEQLWSGRLPVPGAEEVVAGHQATHKDRLQTGGRRFQVVGVLRRDVALFADGYLVPPDGSLDKLFDGGPPSAQAAILIRLAPDQPQSSALRKKIREAFPKERFSLVGPMIHVERGAYYLYQAGQALLLLGGSGFLIGLYPVLRRRARWRVLRTPLTELSRRRRLLWAVHLGYFGLTILASLLIYEAAPVQTALLGVVQSQIGSGEGVLGIAGKAYGSGQIPIAAATTFGINFLLGSLVHITLPSLIVPGSGVLMAAFRAIMWGVLLAPTFTSLSMASLPHSLTILLEGEAYILASFFALLLPIYLFRRRPAGVFARYGRGVSINLEGALLVAAVVFVAACYEAVEVILMKG
jgi:hypothetical protein